MELKEQVMQEIQKVPEQYLPDILDYIRTLESKILRESLGISIASESSLKKDWLKSEEDEAWKNL